MNEIRPNPDELLAHVTAQEAKQSRGKIKIFLGFAPGVGKTFAMLQEAQARKADGEDVAVGLVETHGRAETKALLQGLPQIPLRTVEYHGLMLHEFDLDAALARRPGLLLVDELAHTNAPGMRHAKRWQDVEELIAAGVNVYTTLNVQHLESLNDVVAQITGVVVNETIPDSVLDNADELELVDLTPEELLERLSEGKVYVPEMARNAIQNFFRKGNLIALRQIALRRAAARVDAQMQDYRRDKAIHETWPARERLLLCISPSPYSERLVRATRRMAEGLQADWVALYVETPATLKLPQTERDRAFQTLRLAEQLGGKTATINGQNLRDEILRYARNHNITKIVVGKPKRRNLRDMLLGSVVDEIIWRCDDIDVYVISGDSDTPVQRPGIRQKQSMAWKDYAWSVITVAACTGIAVILFPYFHLDNLIMIYLLGVMAVAARLGRGPSILASVLGVITFDVCFVQPYFSLAVSDTQYLITFLVMLLVGLTISDMTARVRNQAEAARKRERETSALYDLSRELTGAQDLEDLLRVATNQVARMAESRAVILLPDRNGFLIPRFGDPSLLKQGAKELAVAEWVFMRGQMAGSGTQTLPDAGAIYIPLRIPGAVLGVLGLEPSPSLRLSDPERMRFVEAFCGQVAMALERESLAKEAREAYLMAEAERMRNTLLNSVSHDLRTPLTVIAGSVGSLLARNCELPPEARQEMLQDVYLEAQRLDNLVRNLLEMSRIQSGTVKINKEWHVISELVGVVLNRMDSQLQGRPIITNIPPDLPLIMVDAILMEQVFVNLIENALKYTPPESEILIRASVENGEMQIEISDRGPGFTPGQEKDLFTHFYQAGKGDSRRGVGLGLAICKGIVEIHGGRILAENRQGGGATFRISLPMAEEAPRCDDTDGETQPNG